MLRIRTIVHPTDFSEFSKHAFHLACSLAGDHGARLIVVHVVPEAGIVGGVMAPPPAEDFQETRENLARIKSPDPRVALEHRLLAGDPATEICELAKKANAGLLVLGTHGRSGLNRFLVGSVAEQVMRRAHCPVLTVRVPVRIVRHPARKRTAVPLGK